MKPRFFVALLATAAVLSLAGCGKDSPTPRAHAGTTTTIAALAAATGTPVLDIVPKPGADAVAVDFATLDALAGKTYTVTEPFEKKQITFKGVDLWQVLRSAGVPASATSVHIVALDDYGVDLSVADLRAGGVILATQADGQPIPLDHGGPTRVVFLEGVDAGANPDQWIWSLAHITVS